MGIDLGMGYGLRGNFARRQGPVHGPYTELSWLIALPKRRADRLTLGAQIHALDDGRASYAFTGGRVGARAALEWTARFATSFELRF